MTAIGPLVIMQCNRCPGHLTIRADSIDEARVRLRDEGWGYSGGLPDRDYCPDCVERGFGGQPRYVSSAEIQESWTRAHAEGFRR